MLIVAACGAVAAIVRVLLKCVDAVVGGNVGGIAHESRAGIGILIGQYNLLAPVTDDVAHEGRTGARSAMSGPARFLRELGQSVAQHPCHHHVGAPARAARRVNPLALQVAVPPDAFEH